jgi:putative membrane protein insertion efficiency factor
VSARTSRSRARGAFVALALVALLGWDLSRPPREQWSARGLVGSIRLYQRLLSPRMGRLGVRCRFEPTCSRYAEAVLLEDGALVGSGRAMWRLVRCGPWTPLGTADPP